MAEETKTTIDTSLIGKSLDDLTPAELGALSSQLSVLTAEIESRRNAIKDEVEAEESKKLCAAAKVYAQALAWAKMPKLQIVPSDDGSDYVKVTYATGKRKGNGNGGKRSASEVNSGGITVNKIGIAKGGIAWFKDSEGTEHETIKALVMALKQPDTDTSEAVRCWDITVKQGAGKGISASDIVTKYHADEVTLVFNDGSEMLVKDAVEEMKKARTAA